MMKSQLKANLKLLLILVVIGCDFTPRLHKEVILAQEKLKSQDYQEAITLYEKILKGNISKYLRMKISFQLGELYSLHLGKYSKAIFYYEEVRDLADDPKWQVKAEEKLADINFSFLKEYKESLRIYKKLFSFMPRLESYQFYKFRYAMSLFKMHESTSAERAFSEITQDETSEYNIRSMFFIGLIEFENKEWERSIKQLREYIKKEKRKDDIVQAKFLMANAYETMEDLKKAYNLYYSILGEYPNTEVLKNRLNSIYSRRVARKR